MSIEKRITKNGHTYKTVLRIHGIKKSKTFKRKQDAIDWERIQKAKEIRGEIDGTCYDHLSFADLSSLWLKRYSEIKNAYSSVVKNRGSLRNYLLPAFGYKNVNEITTEMIADYVSKIREEGYIKNATINRQLALLKKIFNDAITWKRMKHNPMIGIEMLPEEEPKLQYWNAEEVETFLNVAEESPYYLLYLVALNTGMRLGELLALKWDCIDFKNKLITVKRTYIKELRQIIEKTKGGKRRHVGMNDTLFDAFVLAFNERDKQCELVFHENGNVIRRTRLQRQHFEKEIKRAKVKRIRLHDLRHTFASHFVMNGGSLYDLQKILGHSDLRTTQIYAHLSQDYLKEKMNLIGFGLKKPLKNVGCPLFVPSMVAGGKPNSYEKV